MTTSLARPERQVSDPTLRRVPHLTSAVVGNGEMLVTLSAHGELERIFWPNVDWGQHLGEIRLGLRCGAETVWLDEPQLEHAQRYLDDQNVVETVTHGPSWSTRALDFVSADDSVLHRIVATDAPDASLVIYARPELDESARYGAVYVDRPTGALVFYRRGRALAVGTSRPGSACAGRASSGEHGSAVFRQATAGALGGGAVEFGVVDGALIAPMAEGEIGVFVACGDTPTAAVESITRAQRDDLLPPLQRRRAADAALLASATQLELGGAERRLYRRSVLAFELLADRNTGAVIAAPEMDGNFDHSGGYGFVWGRDMAFALLAFLASGREQLARRAVRWLLETQSPEGLWLHRHCADGSLGPSWGLHQLDETGAILMALKAAVDRLPDLRQPRLLDAVASGARFLATFRHAQTGLPLPSVDLWEERLGVHTYTAAAVGAGLRASAHLLQPDRRSDAVGYGRAADEISAAIERHFWDESLGRYRRSLASSTDTAEALLRYPGDLARSARSEEVGDDGAAVDASLLGLAWPFTVVDPAGRRMRQTAAAIERELSDASGGLRRYAGDTYAGGNAWILTTLWLGLWYRQVGDEAGYRRCIDYVIARQTGVGLLPEQVAADGTPSWVIPLTWSHAMFVLAVAPPTIW